MLSPISSTYLNNLQSAQLTLLQQLSSGSSVNSASDNPSGLSLAVSLSSQATGMLQAEANAGDGIALADTAASAVGQIGATLQQMRSLAVQAGDGSLNAGDRQAIQDQIGQLGQQLQQISGQTQFNGQNLLNGTFSASIQTGAGSGQTTALAIGDMSGSALGVASLDLGTAAGALDAIDQALATVSAQQGQLGAAANGLTAAQSYAAASADNLLAARSNITDTDYAAATSKLVQNGVQSQAAMKALTMYRSMQQLQISSLLP